MSARIMVVEDEEALTTLLRYNLDAEGYDVETVARGDEAELKLRESTPDLIVLDWMLPGLSGIELCRRLRSRTATAQLPIIMLTARGEETDRVRGLASLCMPPCGAITTPVRSRSSSARSTARPIAPSANGIDR